MASVWFEGVEELNRLGADLNNAGVIAASRGPLIIRKTAADIVRDAQAIVPVDTGALKSSIGFDMVTVLEAEVGPTQSYGGFVEWGTARQAPAAYMGPATDRNAPAFYAAVAQLGSSAIEGR